jgi:hypothetical protein
MPPMKPRTKAPQNEQLGGIFAGDLASYVAEALPQSPLSERTRYRINQHRINTLCYTILDLICPLWTCNFLILAFTSMG